MKIDELIFIEKSRVLKIHFGQNENVQKKLGSLKKDSSNMKKMDLVLISFWKSNQCFKNHKRQKFFREQNEFKGINSY